MVYKQIGALTPQIWQREFLPRIDAPAPRVRPRPQRPGLTGEMHAGGTRRARPRRRCCWCCACLGACGPRAAVDSTPPLPDAGAAAALSGAHARAALHAVPERGAGRLAGAAWPADLRREVRDLLLPGKTDQQIRDHMVARYGEFILFRPPMNWRNAWLWGAPPLLMLIGARGRLARRCAAHGAWSIRTTDELGDESLES